MSTKRTQNYQFHAWAPEDEESLAELNANFAKLDTALKAEVTARQSAVTERALIVTGSYVGDGQSERTVSLGFTPKAVMLVNSEGRMGWSGNSEMGAGGLALPGKSVTVNFAAILEIVTNGFRVRHQSSFITTNKGNAAYYYLVLR